MSIRVQALQGLCNLLSHVPTHAITELLVDIMHHDSVPLIRRILVTRIPSLIALLRRVYDVDLSVRTAVYERLCGMCTELTSTNRALVINRGLKEENGQILDVFKRLILNWIPAANSMFTRLQAFISLFDCSSETQLQDLARVLEFILSDDGLRSSIVFPGNSSWHWVAMSFDFG